MSLFSPDGKRLFVANAGAATISVVDVGTREVTKTLPGGRGMMAFVPTADWKLAWLTAPADDQLIILNLAKAEIVARIDVPGEPHGLVLSPDGTRAYVVQRKLNQIAIVDTASRRVIKTAEVGDRPDMLAISSDGATLYVTSRNENKLLVVSASDLAVLGEVATGEEPHGVAYRE